LGTDVPSSQHKDLLKRDPKSIIETSHFLHPLLLLDLLHPNVSDLLTIRFCPIPDLLVEKDMNNTPMAIPFPGEDENIDSIVYSSRERATIIAKEEKDE